MSKMQAGTNMNMEDIMRMNEALKPFQERPKDVDGENFNEKGQHVEGLIGNIEDESKYMKDFEDDLKDSIDLMTSDIFKFFDDTYNEFNPEVSSKFRHLKGKIKEQKDENANLLKQIDLLIQENTQIMDTVYKLGMRLQHLEKKTGVEKVEYEEKEESEYEEGGYYHT
jgi:hypothetical protein